MANVHISTHPLVKHKLGILRDVATEPVQFRQLIRELALLMCYEATQDLPLRDAEARTPMGMAKVGRMTTEIGLVPILRSGLGMVDGLWELIPSAEVWHIGLYRDEKTLRPVEYYNKLPVEPRVQVCLILDPMLATGGSAIATVDILKRWGVQRIKFMGLIAAPEGLKALTTAHPDVDVYLAALDERLNEIGYIVPGLGDAGDRQFGTA
ncbi:MAG TPA: uracil phosphoribosyltransferase [Aggregatilineales bacterium]|nr:uracil phosphoribosyltransferase [Aggregatilineales bacterium]